MKVKGIESLIKNVGYLFLKDINKQNIIKVLDILEYSDFYIILNKNIIHVNSIRAFANVLNTTKENKLCISSSKNPAKNITETLKRISNNRKELFMYINNQNKKANIILNINNYPLKNIINKIKVQI